MTTGKDLPKEVIEPDEPTQDADQAVWYFAFGGQRRGPYAESEMRDWVAQGSVTSETPVWSPGMAEWQSMANSSLATATRLPSLPEPPPLSTDIGSPGSRVSIPESLRLSPETVTAPVAPQVSGRPGDDLVWMLAFAPIIGALMEGFLAGLLDVPMGNLWFVTLFLNVILSSADSTRLQAAGYNAHDLGAAWLIPIYLHNRARVLGDSMAYVAAWWVCFLVSLQ